jgi:RNA polymerase sigma-70 factor (ECF subfamily)
MIPTFNAVSSISPSTTPNKNLTPRPPPASFNRSRDWDIIQRCKQGDMAAWDSLVGRYEKPVYKFAFSLCKNYDDASDVAGQVFVRLFDYIHTFRNDSHFSSWLFCIVRNIYVDTCLRATHRSHLSLDEGLEVDGGRLARDITDPALSPEEHLLQTERRDVLIGVIHHLPDYQRKIISLYYAEDRSYDEIAGLTGVPVGTVKSRLYRARKMLRSRLESIPGGEWTTEARRGTGRA